MSHAAGCAPATLASVRAELRKLHAKIGDLVEVDGRLYDLIPETQGGATLEPAITKTVDEIRAEHGGRPLTPEEFEEFFGPVPPTGEG